MVRHDSFCVAVDGSHVSYNALRLALTLMNEHDTLLAVHIHSEAADGGGVGGADESGRGHKHIDGDALLNNARVEALKLRLRPEQIRAEIVQLTDGKTIDQLLVTIANTRAKLFVMGASGRGSERTSVTPKPLGSVAEQVLYHAKVPVILMRSDRGGKFAFREEVDGRAPRPPIQFGVAVSATGRQPSARGRAGDAHTYADLPRLQMSSL
jgi:nucleotide-binding universal stress UspA family protein